MSSLVLMRWTEPEDGSHAFVVSMSGSELRHLEDAIEWLADEAGDEWGHTIPAFEVTGPQEGVHGGYDFDQAMRELRMQSRYEEGGVYTKQYQPFEELS